MATWVGVGTSKTSDSFKAGEEAARTALELTGNSSSDWVLVFASVCFDQTALLKGVVSMTKEAPLAGCSTAGEILREGPLRRSVVVMTIRSDSLKVAVGLGRGIRENPRQAGRDAATQAIQAKSSPHAFVIFPDGLTGNGAEVIRGMQDVLGLSFPIVGGSAGDDFGFKQTYQYFQGKVYTNAVAGVLLCGAVQLGVGARHGWKPLGRSRVVTKASANTVQELDGAAAVTLYEEYFGKKAFHLGGEELARISIMYPLGFPVPGEEEYLLRNAIGANANGGLIFSGEVPEGTQVRLMMGSKEKALEAARTAAEQAVLSLAPHSPTFGLIFSCTSRAQLFGRRIAEEVAAIRTKLGEEVPLIGFYDYGEQAPLTAADFLGRSHYHNETVVVVAVAAP